MKDLLKKMMIGTFIERPARKMHALFKQARSVIGPPRINNKNRIYDTQTVEIMKRILKQDSNCIDVGCHQGSILGEILNLAPKGTHFAFEPLPEMYRGLREVFGNIQNLLIYDYALSDVAGETSFQHVVTNPGYSGFRKRRYDRPYEQTQEISVKTELLDKLIHRDLPIHFIKIDVEGAELQVFKGALETIKKHRPFIIFEHGLGAADHYGTNPESIYDLLAGECHLRLFLMSEWLKNTNQDSLSREDFCEQFYSGKNFYFLAAI